jgi:hypothetical protein
VLILGRFTPERKAILDGVRDHLRALDLVPVLFDFAKPNNRGYTETVSILAHMARFVIVDVTDPKIVLEEIPHIVRNIAVPVQPIVLRDAGDEPVTLNDLRRNHRSLLPTLTYDDPVQLSQLLSTIVVERTEAMRKLLSWSGA